MKLSIGHSDDPDSLDAVEEAIEAASSGLYGSPPKGAILLCSSEYDATVVVGKFAERYPDLPTVGSTTDGGFSSVAGLLEDGVIVVLFAGEHISCSAFVIRDLSKGFADQINTISDALGDAIPKLCLVAPDVLTTDVATVADFLSSSFPNVPTFGFGAADHRSFDQTAEFYGNEVLSDAMPIFFVFGQVEVSAGMASGWVPAHRERQRVTKVNGNVIQEINNRPAIEYYERYWGTMPQRQLLAEFPLAIWPPQGDQIMRAFFDFDADTGAITTGGRVPLNSEVSMTVALPNGVIAGSVLAAKNAMSLHKGTPSAVFSICCAARKWVLGTKTEQDVQAIADVIGQDVPFVGLYAFAEIAITPQVSSGYHNQTCVMVALGAGE